MNVPTCDEDRPVLRFLLKVNSILPGRGAASALLLAFFSLEFVAILFGLYPDGYRLQLRPSQEVIPIVYHFGWVILVSISLAAGMLFRHPSVNNGYSRWLNQIPWQPGKPLPLGSITPTVKDILFLATVALPLARTQLLFQSPFWQSRIWIVYSLPFVVFSIIYVLISFAIQASLFPWRACGLAFSLALVLPIGSVSLSTVPIVLAVLCALSALLNRQAVLRAPWMRVDNSQPQRKLSESIWPHDFLFDLSPFAPENPAFGVAQCALYGWWLFCVAFLFRNIRDDRSLLVGFFVTLLALLLLFVLTVSRLQLYLKGFKGPLSFFGRLLLFKWIIPGHDIIFLAPLLVVAWLILTLLGIKLLAVYHLLSPLVYYTVCSVFSSVSGVILLYCPPDIQTWKLTGMHRIVPPNRNPQTGRTAGQTPLEELPVIREIVSLVRQNKRDQ